MSNTKRSARPRLVEIKKYANRRLYDITHSGYITLADLAHLVASGKLVRVTDAKTGDDLTAATLLQILLEMENDGHGLLSIETLSRLIAQANYSEADFVKTYIERALDRLEGDNKVINNQPDYDNRSDKTDLADLVKSFNDLTKAFQQFEKNN